MLFNNNASDDKQTNNLKNPPIKHPKKVCLWDININYIRNTLDSLFKFTYDFVGFPGVSETKLDSSFRTGQFNLSGFSQANTLLPKRTWFEDIINLLLLKIWERQLWNNQLRKLYKKQWNYVVNLSWKIIDRIFLKAYASRCIF